MFKNILYREVMDAKQDEIIETTEVVASLSNNQEEIIATTEVVASLSNQKKKKTENEVKKRLRKGTYVVV